MARSGAYRDNNKLELEYDYDVNCVALRRNGGNEIQAYKSNHHSRRADTGSDNRDSSGVTLAYFSSANCNVDYSPSFAGSLAASVGAGSDASARSKNTRAALPHLWHSLRRLVA